MEHKITVTSPFSASPRPHQFAGDPFYQHKVFHQALETLLRDPFETNRDLREVTISLTMHADGLHVTAELLDGRASRSVETVDLLGKDGNGGN